MAANHQAKALKNNDKVECQNVFKRHCRKSFRKVRVSKKRFIKPLPSEVSNLIVLRNALLKDSKVSAKTDVQHLDEEIANKKAEVNRNKIMKNSPQSCRIIILSSKQL